MDTHPVRAKHAPWRCRRSRRTKHGKGNSPEGGIVTISFLVL